MTLPAGTDARSSSSRRGGPIVAVAAALATAATLLLAVTPALAARGSATPVGPLPAGKHFTVRVLRDATFVIRAPKRPANSGLVWRIARSLNPKVAVEVAEGEDRLNVWLRFKATGVGSAKIVLALTKGETRTAYAARTWAVTVREPGTA